MGLLLRNKHKESFFHKMLCSILKFFVKICSLIK